jgi:phage gp29-like protein
MPDTISTLLDQYGNPIKRELLGQSIAGPSLSGIRSPLSGYPGDGLNPRRLARILREADAGDPLRYFELAEQIEERDLHYTGVLGTRKRSVAQLDINVDAASDDAEQVEQADMIRSWLARDTLQDELFDMLDAIGKGVSFTEIIWDSSSGQHWPARLEWRDPRWTRPDRADGVTPLLRADGGDVPLAPFKFVRCVIRAKSGLPIRSGIARLAAWSWMFKAFTQRDWAIFTQTFGQPVRVGKYPAGATEKDKDTLFAAVANIAGDCAAIIPESMTIDFIEAGNVGASHALYKERADWCDQQVSKAILGQTATTDAIAGGHAVGQEHRKVQEDIERADAKALSAVLNRDLVVPMIMLNFGPQPQYPRLRIGRADEADIKQLTDSVVALVPYGLKVGKAWMNDQLGIPDPEESEELLTAPAVAPSPFGSDRPPPPLASARPTPARQAASPARRTADDIAAMVAATERLAQPAMDEVIGVVRDAVARATSLPDLRHRLRQLRLPDEQLAGALRLALAMAHLAGRDDIASPGPS